MSGFENGFTRYIRLICETNMSVHADPLLPHDLPTLHAATLQLLTKLLALQAEPDSQQEQALHIQVDNFEMRVLAIQDASDQNCLLIGFGKNTLKAIQSATLRSTLHAFVKDILTNYPLYSDEHRKLALDYALANFDKDIPEDVIGVTALHLIRTKTVLEAQKALATTNHILLHIKKYSADTIDHFIAYILLSSSDRPCGSLSEAAITILSNTKKYTDNPAALLCAKHFIATDKVRFNTYTMPVIWSVLDYIFSNIGKSVSKRTVNKAIVCLYNSPNLNFYVAKEPLHLRTIIKHMIRKESRYTPIIITRFIKLIFQNLPNGLLFTENDMAEEILNATDDRFDVAYILCAQYFIASQVNSLVPPKGKLDKKTLSGIAEKITDKLSKFGPVTTKRVLDYIWIESENTSINVFIATITSVLNSYAFFAEILTEQHKKTIFCHIFQNHDNYPEDAISRMLTIFSVSQAQPTEGYKKLMLEKIILNPSQYFPTKVICASFVVCLDPDKIQKYGHDLIAHATGNIFFHLDTYFPGIIKPVAKHYGFAAAALSTTIDFLFSEFDPEISLTYNKQKNEHKALLIDYILFHKSYTEAVFEMTMFVLQNIPGGEGLTPFNQAKEIIFNPDKYSSHVYRYAVIFAEANLEKFPDGIQKAVLNLITDPEHSHHFPPPTGLKRALNFVDDNHRFFTASQTDRAKFLALFSDPEKPRLAELKLITDYSNEFFRLLAKKDPGDFETISDLTLWNEGKYEEVFAQNPAFLAFILRNMEHQVFALWKMIFPPQKIK